MKSNTSIFFLLGFWRIIFPGKKLFDSFLFFFFWSDYWIFLSIALLAFMIILLNVMSFFSIAVFKILSLAFISLTMIYIDFDICKSIHVAFTKLLGCVD